MMDKNLESGEFVSESNLQDENIKSEKNSESTLKDFGQLTKSELIEKLKNLRFQDEVPSRLEVDSIRQTYYTIRRSEIDEEKKIFEETAQEGEIFSPTIDPSEDVVKEYLSKIKEKRAKKLAEEEKVKEKNHQQKAEIIAEIEKLISSTDDFNKRFKEFKDLQSKWSQIGAVPQLKNKTISTEYQVQVEKFYDLVKINNELRDYDFKKNLENKNALIEAASKLLQEIDPVSAFHQLQNFHEQWKEIGPVEKELRESSWQEFKDISTQINKNYQAHFEELKEKEEENLKAKQAIIEKLKEVDLEKLISFKEWDKATEQVIALQSEWKKIGFVPKKYNTNIFEEFRSICDSFFAQKSTFFKEVKTGMDDNLKLKQALVEQAKALKESTDWNKTSQELIRIQKEWKTIGPVSRKHSDAIWKEFVEACDYFFDQKKKIFSSQKEDEINNYKAKKEIVEQIKNLASDIDSEVLLSKLKELQEKWHQIGFVPFKDKDRSYKELYAAVDSHYDRLKINKSERRFEEFKSNVEGRIASNGANAERILSKEKDYLTYQYNKIKADLQVYENNMNFLSLSSKNKENPLLKNVNQKVESLRAELELIEKKIISLETNLNDLE